MYKIKNIVNKIHHADCMNFIQKIPDKSIDLLYTDPPYNQGFHGAGSLAKKYEYREKDILPISNFEPEPFLKIIKPKLKAFHAYIWTSKNLLDKYIKFAKNNDYNWDILVWSKKNPLPAYNNTYLSDIEFCMFVREKRKCTFNNKLEYKIYFKTMIDNVAKNEFNHPTQKHLWMIKKALKISSNEEDIILDPFAGTSSTAVAAQYLKRKFIMIEINKKYVDIGIKRIAQKTLNI